MFSPYMDYIQHGCDEDERAPCSNTDGSAEYWQGHASGLCHDQSACIDPNEMPADDMQVDSCQFGDLAFEGRHKEIEKRIEEIRKDFIQQQALVKEKTAELEEMIKSQTEANARLDSRLRRLEIRLAANLKSGYKKTFLPEKASVYSLPTRPMRKRKCSNTNHDTDRLENKRCRYI